MNTWLVCFATVAVFLIGLKAGSLWGYVRALKECELDRRNLVRALQLTERGDTDIPNDIRNVIRVAVTSSGLVPLADDEQCRRIAERRAREMTRPESYGEPDSVCVELDGCPTERAVLQRYWRSMVMVRDRLSRGYKLVPPEPTYQMAEAMGIKWESGEGFPWRYRAMLAEAQLLADASLEDEA